VREVIDMLTDNGFTLKSRKGSHMKFEKDGLTVIVPDYGSKCVEKGTYFSIMRQAGLKFYQGSVEQDNWHQRTSVVALRLWRAKAKKVAVRQNSKRYRCLD